MFEKHWQSQLTIVIPAYNEDQGIPSTLINLKKSLPDVKIIVVDDASTDNTAAAALEVDKVRVIRHGYNYGYGGALKTGMVYADTEFVAWFDADGEHRIEDLIEMVDIIYKVGCVAVIGQRTTGSTTRIRAVGKWLIRLLASSLDVRAGSDLNCGLRVYKRDVICRYLSVLPDGYSASLTSLMIMLEQGYPISFHPVKTEPRIGNSKVRLMDGFSTMALVLRIVMLFAPLRIFFRGGILLFLASIIYSVSIAYSSGLGVPVGGALGVLAGGMLLVVGLIADQISQLRLLQLSSNQKLPFRSIKSDNLPN
ncbi:glycosyltransferase family 2 protein [bacterium]|nr:glycosyltransferase family 2 protein [bacterium]